MGVGVKQWTVRWSGPHGRTRVRAETPAEEQRSLGMTRSQGMRGSRSCPEGKTCPPAQAEINFHVFKQLKMEVN